MKTERWFMKCRECRKNFAVDIDRDPSRPYADPLLQADYMTCPLCGYTPPGEYDDRGRLIFRLCYPREDHIRMGKVGSQNRLMAPADRCRCDRRCTGARGPNCECKCGGKNHGSEHLATVRRDDGDATRREKNLYFPLDTYPVAGYTCNGG